MHAMTGILVAAWSLLLAMTYLVPQVIRVLQYSDRELPLATVKLWTVSQWLAGNLYPGQNVSGFSMITALLLGLTALVLVRVSETSLPEVMHGVTRGATATRIAFARTPTPVLAATLGVAVVGLVAAAGYLAVGLGMPILATIR